MDRGGIWPANVTEFDCVHGIMDSMEIFSRSRDALIRVIKRNRSSHPVL